MNKSVFTSAEGEENEFVIEAQIRLYGRDYLLVSEDTDGEEAEAMILTDISDAESEEAVYVEVTDENEIAALMPLFEEELTDVSIDR